MAKADDPHKKIDTFEWASPRPAMKFDWPVIAEKLRTKPMEYARLFEQGPVSIINALRQGKIADLHPDNGFEFKTEHNRREAPRLADLFVRYNPEKESDIRAAVREAKKKVK